MKTFFNQQLTRNAISKDNKLLALANAKGTADDLNRLFTSNEVTTIPTYSTYHEHLTFIQKILVK